MATNTRIPWSFWLVGAIALVWHGMGCANLYMQLTPELLLQMPESHRAVAEARPGWATIAFAISTVAGVLAAMALLLRNRIAGPLFFLSLIGALVAVGQAIMAGALQRFGPAEIAFGVIGPAVFGLFMVWYARHASRLGWMHGRAAER